FGFAENTDDLFVGKTLLHGDVLMWLMKTLLTSGCTNQRGAGHQLLYNYRNQPKTGEEHLTSHVGFAEFRFDDGLKSAEGHYFNGQGRATYGTMTITRIDNV
ncbi:hypothetical protein, partial [Klebsiella pneumoniae]